jgi:hypothetical protein
VASTVMMLSAAGMEMRLRKDTRPTAVARRLTPQRRP